MAIFRSLTKRNWAAVFSFRTICCEKPSDGFRIVGRISDVINVAGKKVNPAEVEAELLRCTGVQQAVVFGRESSLRNQEVAACVVGGPGVTESQRIGILPPPAERLAGRRSRFFWSPKFR